MAIDREGIIKAGEAGRRRGRGRRWSPSSTWGGVPSRRGRRDLRRRCRSTRYDVDEGQGSSRPTAGVDGQKIVIATSPISRRRRRDRPGDRPGGAATSASTPKIKTISPDQYTTLFSDPAARKGIDLFFTAWYTSLADPMEMYGVLRTGEFSNYGGWSDPDVRRRDRRRPSPTRSTTRPARPPMANAQQIASEQLPWLPLYTPPTTLWLGDRITGVAPSIYYMYYPWAATIGAKG